MDKSWLGWDADTAAPSNRLCAYDLLTHPIDDSRAMVVQSRRCDPVRWPFLIRRTDHVDTCAENDRIRLLLFAPFRTRCKTLSSKAWSVVRFLRERVICKCPLSTNISRSLNLQNAENQTFVHAGGRQPTNCPHTARFKAPAAHQPLAIRAFG